MYMKTLLTAFLILSTSIIYSGNDTIKASDSSFTTEVNNIILSDKATPALQLSGTAAIIFSVDKDNKMILENIYTDNYVAAFHIRHLLEGKELKAYNVCPGKTYQMVIDFRNQPLARTF